MQAPPPEPRQRTRIPTTPEEKNDSKSFKKLVLDFTEYTSAHGIGRLGASKTIFRKIFWSVVCLGALSMFLYQFIALLQQYLSKPVSTSISVTFEKRLAFPAVTVCNLNMLRKDVMPDEVRDFLSNNVPDYTGNPTNNPNGSQGYNPTYQQGTDYPTDHQGTDDPTYQQGTDDPENDDYLNNDEYYYDDNYDKFFDEDYDEEFQDINDLNLEMRLRLEIDQVIGGLNENILYHTGHMFENFIRNCSWKGLDCKSGNLSKFWTRQWNYKYGNCFTFNGGTNEDGETARVLKATKPGPSQGLLLEIDIEQEQYIGPLTLEAGIRVTLHEQGHMVFPYEEGFSVSPGRSTSIGIKKTKMLRLDRFNNKSCLPQDELPRMNIYRLYKNITVYSQQACLNSCLGSSQMERCKCSEESFPSDIAPCNIFKKKISKCLKTVKYLFNNDKLPCLSDCRQPCKEEVIQKTISSSQWPSNAYKDHLIAQGIYDDESDDLLQLNVFFNELNYEQIEEQFSYGTINLLADLGGQLGLWIGISAITCFEVLELILMFVTVCCKKFNRSNQVQHVSAFE